MLLTFHAYALSDALREKYPHILLTPEDYGILSEKDLKVEVQPTPFSPKDSLADLYWQCFSTQNISPQLNDMGYSSSDLKENDGFLKLVIHNQNTIHEYIMRRNWPIKGCAQRLKEWKTLMNHQQYACILGRYSHQITESKDAEKYVWVFEKLKTMRGEESYFFEH